MTDLKPIILSFELAAITTAVLLLLSIPLAYWLADKDFKFKPVISALISMPLVLPPTVLGFYLLVAFSPNYFFGGMLEK
ncbi:MAG: hypothetical protein WCE54_03510, partial [Ignavibacteriaceae bacterium]